MSEPSTLPVVLPTSSGAVRGLLGAMEDALRADAKRVMKQYKVNADDIGVQDRLHAADEIQKAREIIEAANRKRWNQTPKKS